MVNDVRMISTKTAALGVDFTEIFPTFDNQKISNLGLNFHERFVDEEHDGGPPKLILINFVLTSGPDSSR